MIKIITMLFVLFGLLHADEKKTVAVTYSILGSLTKELVGDKLNVEVIIPNGQDMHEWKPSVQDIQKLMKANLIVQNGLDAEEGLEKSINQASKKGVKVFTASNYVQVRKLKAANSHGHSDGDPHFWLDPISMKAVVNGLSESIKKEFNIDVSQNALVISKKLDDLSAGILTQTAVIPEQNRKLVTGHDSLGYYAARYNFAVIGAVIPSFTTGAQASAAQVSKLEKLIKTSKVPAIFSEIGTPKQVVSAISKDTGAKVVELTDHILPSDGSYYTMMNNMTATIVEALK